MNFAYGGTGVFETINSNLNMTYQIGLFEQLIGDIYSPSDLSSALALVSVAGNDYITYLAGNGSEWVSFLYILHLLSLKCIIIENNTNMIRYHNTSLRNITYKTSIYI